MQRKWDRNASGYIRRSCELNSSSPSLICLTRFSVCDSLNKSRGTATDTNQSAQGSSGLTATDKEAIKR
jgi:hypothetical protein